MTKTVVITSGYFNPLHPWHIECLELCKDLWDKLWLIVNNDKQVRIKTWEEKVFQNQDFRLRVASALKPVDRAIIAIDKDWSVCESIRYISDLIKKEYWADTKIVFGKWGDRFVWDIPEVQVCKELDIEIKDWLGAKIFSSSDFRKKV